MSSLIPFNRPCLAGNEYGYIAEAIANGHASGDGPFTRRCHEILEQELNAPKVLLTTSCTHALEMAALLLDCQSGDEIIVPSFTFVSTANAFALRGARIVFADIRPDTLNLDETRLESLITRRTKAIVPVHYAGVACEMDAICAIAQQHHVRVVEDNAHGLFAPDLPLHDAGLGWQDQDGSVVSVRDATSHRAEGQVRRRVRVRHRSRSSWRLQQHPLFGHLPRRGPILPASERRVVAAA